MKPASRRELDFQLVISAVDTAITHGEWVKAATHVVALWKITEECGGEWKEVKAMVVKYVKDWVANKEPKSPQHQTFFDTMTLNGVNVYKSFGVVKEKKPRPVKKPILDENKPIDLPTGDFLPPYMGDYMPIDQQPAQPDEPKD
jgi:hypothetical protein